MKVNAIMPSSPAFKSLKIEANARGALLNLESDELKNIEKRASELNKTKYYDLEIGYREDTDRLYYSAVSKDPLIKSCYGPISYYQKGRVLHITNPTHHMVQIFYKNDKTAKEKLEFLDKQKTEFDKAVELTKILDRRRSDEIFWCASSASRGFEKKSEKEIEKALEKFYNTPTEEEAKREKIVNKLMENYNK